MLTDLDDLVEPDAKGDPMCPLRWTTKSLANLADELVEQGHQISTATVADLLRYMDYRLQRPTKAVEGRQHPDRDGQFRYLAKVVGEFLDAGQPAVSVDAKKKELVGNHINGGVEYEPAGSPVRVDVHDFPDPEIGKAIPYGGYDLAANNAWVSVGDVHDTAEFAVATIERWWDTMGQPAYPNASKLAITADAGGSNAYREVAPLAVELGVGDPLG